MAVLYVDEYGATLRWTDGLVTIEKDGRRLASVRSQELEYVVVLENCSLTSAAVAGCLRAGVDVCFVSSGGDFLGKIEPVMSKNVSLRRAQYAAAAEPAFCLALAKRFVAGKLANMRTIIMRYSRDPARADIAAKAEALKSAARGASAADTLEQLMGA